MSTITKKSETRASAQARPGTRNQPAAKTAEAQKPAGRRLLTFSEAASTGRASQPLQKHRIFHAPQEERRIWNQATNYVQASTHEPIKTIEVTGSETPTRFMVHLRATRAAEEAKEIRAILRKPVPRHSKGGSEARA